MATRTSVQSGNWSSNLARNHLVGYIVVKLTRNIVFDGNGANDNYLVWNWFSVGFTEVGNFYVKNKRRIFFAARVKFFKLVVDQAFSITYEVKGKLETIKLVGILTKE